MKSNNLDVLERGGPRSIGVRNSKGAMIIALWLVHFILPALALVFLAFFKMPLVIWAAYALAAAAGILFLYLAGYWGTFFRPVRYFLLPLLAGSFVYPLAATGHFPPGNEHPGTVFLLLLPGLLLALFFVVQTIKALSARSYPGEPVNVGFPFGEGIFAISDGGNGARSRFMNYHFRFAGHARKGTNEAMKYAVDIVELSGWGAAAWNLFPSRNEKYPIFGRTVLSPCDGRVVSVENDMADNEPFGPKPYNLGNHIAVKSDGFQVVLGHLRRSSIRMKIGDHVAKGQPLAEAGNSGWTERPHLHMQAMKTDRPLLWENEGLPVCFDGRNPVKNTIFKATKNRA